MTLDRLTRDYDLTSDEQAAFAAFDDLFTATAAHTNLVARGTLPERWDRHYADSLQLWPLLPDGATTLLDVGAGAGFPGIPLAILAHARRPDLRLTMADSVGKKARFIADAVATLRLRSATATNARVETLNERYGVVTARAVAALPKLLGLCAPRLAPGGTLILPKGARADEELAVARSDWQFEVSCVKSRTDEAASILVITDLERR